MSGEEIGIMESLSTFHLVSAILLLRLSSLTCQSILCLCPLAVVKQTEKLQRGFLWHGRGIKRRFHLLEWSKVCKLKKEGGLGFRPLKLMNGALLGKWLWKLGDEFD